VNALAVLKDGTVFRCNFVGADGVATGEAVFNTAMSGYQEIFTDPSYAEQVVVMTSPQIGNYGVTSEDDQADRVFASGVVMRAMTRSTSNWRAQGSLFDFFVDRGVVAVADLDTRRLTRHLRDHGAQPIILSASHDERELKDLAGGLGGMTGKDLASGVSTAEPYFSEASGPKKGLVAALDLGIKRDIVRHLNRHGHDVWVLPADTSPEAVQELSPTGLFLSNGPGDPEPLESPISTIRQLLGVVPIFGICLGHQLLGLALGGGTYKLGFGHHGGNHPVRNLLDGTVAITSQNHGFCVDPWTMTSETSPSPHSGIPRSTDLPAELSTTVGAAVPTHQNLNDGTLEGLRCLDVPAFSVQYHPEAAPGPQDALSLFDDFDRLMGF